MTSVVDEVPAAADAEVVAPAEDDELLAGLLVEEISIDGMCGVY